MTDKSRPSLNGSVLAIYRGVVIILVASAAVGLWKLDNTVQRMTVQVGHINGTLNDHEGRIREIERARWGGRQ